MADAVEKGKVEKGKNELILFFTCAPVETGISQSNVSQRAYESCRLEIGLIVCPPTSFSDCRTGASKSARCPISDPIERPFSVLLFQENIAFSGIYPRKILFEKRRKRIAPKCANRLIATLTIFCE